MTSDRIDRDREGVPWPVEPPPEQAEVYPFPTSANIASAPAGEARPFARVDLGDLARHGIAPPELVCDQLLYRGGLHSLAGPPDSGKSTLLYLWTLQLLSLGEPVVLLDEEAGRELATEKLLALGATPELLAGLVYVEFPARAWDQPDRRGLAALLAAVRPALVGFDSAGAFLAQAGLRENEAPDVTSFYKSVLLHAAREHRAAVVVLDHIPKLEEATRYARGSGAKLQLVDVALMVEPITPFSRDQGGLLKLQVTKDRRGYLRRAHQVRVEAEDGHLALTVSEAGGVAPGLDDPDLAGLDLAPAARKLLAVLREQRGQQLVASELVDRVKARFGHGLGRQTVSTALNDLAKRDLVDAEEDRSRYGEKRWWAL